MPKGKTAKEEFKVSGEEVLAKIKQLIKAGNVRRIILKNDKGKVIMEIPLRTQVNLEGLFSNILKGCFLFSG